MKRKIKRKTSHFKKSFSIILMVILIAIIAYVSYNKIIKYQKEKEKFQEETAINNIKKHYSQYVITTKETNLLNKDEDIYDDNVSGNEYYELSAEEALQENDGNSKMILLEPRAYSESQQIADHLKSRNTVVVNLKRVTSDQAKRLIDFLTGCIYAIGGSLQKLGNGIYLCTPNNVNVQGKMSDNEEKEKAKTKYDSEIDF